MSLSFFKDRDFLKELLALALPISFQQLITASLNMIDVLMVGQLGETSIAAIGLSNQVFFVFILLLFGLTSGMAIFTAQFWGKQEIEPIRKVLGMSILTASLIGLFFTFAATLIPRTVLGLYTNDMEVIDIGASYLRIVGFSYIPVAIATAYITTLRSIQLVSMTVVATIIALVFKTILGYLLIFGHAGLPALGVQGAAIGTASGWALELILLLIFVYAGKTSLAANPLTFFSFDLSFLGRVLKTTLPAVANEMFWSLGITTYNAIYAHIGTDSIAAINVNATIEEMGFVVFMGLGNACAVMVGNRIGAGKKEEAYETVRRVIILSVLFAWAVGGIVFLVRDAVVGLYDLSPSGEHNVRMLMLMMALVLWVRMFNFSTFIGALRAGGDTRFALLMEVCSIWLIGVPAAYIGAFVLHLPVYYVYLMVTLEELAKAFVSGFRFRSRKWIHDLVNL
ncbi:MAG TPA: MATE family efflux transporter [Anaerolineales bacterium]|nr:MATE family efflux transporter [Anaerolineales bacterium]HNA90369.1 MATE family efflux transporter [Anaerolineales bacterium]HNB36868.1 MATE family efflux transporter [Anaerolineales bacterium]HNC07963.1 MATE family efflux transporter [Anaerolineales bacterium]